MRKLRLEIENPSHPACDNFSAEFAPTSSMLYAGGCHVPPPQRLYSGVGRHHWPTFTPSQLSWQFEHT